MNKKEIEALLAGMRSVVSAKQLSDYIGLSIRMIYNLKNKGKLHTVDRGTFCKADVVNFLLANPRYITMIPEERGRKSADE